jgi:hypothetical protein
VVIQARCMANLARNLAERIPVPEAKRPVPDAKRPPR